MAGYGNRAENLADLVLYFCNCEHAKYMAAMTKS
jgi:hypothetical protein